jgi:hypothetical protein
MHTLNVPIGPDGPLIDVLVGLSAADLQTLRNAGRPVPTPLALHALIDTGAEVSCADPQALAPLVHVGVIPKQFVLANVPAAGGITWAAEYTVSLTIVHPSGNARAHLVLRTQPVVEQSLGQLGYQALIGRDVLARCLHIYNGPAQLFTLAY